MRHQKRTGCLRQISPLLSLLLFTLLSTNGAQAQITAIAHGVSAEAVNDPRFQYYPFTYEVRGSSIWGPGVPGSQQVDFTLPLVSQPWNEHLGAFFDPCFGVFGGCEFGAGLEAGLSASTSADFHAKADLGSVDLHCPGGVGISYPKSADIQPGQPFTIQTYCIVDQTAFMNINATNLSVQIDGRIRAQINLALIAVAAGHDLVRANLFSILGLNAPALERSQRVFDTGNLAQSIKDIPLPIPPNYGSGLFHVPQLGARGTLRDDLLKARAADNFLTLHSDLTNLLLQYFAFGLPLKVNGDYEYGGFNVGLHLFDLQLQAALGIRQDFTFDPRPLIKFTTSTGQTQTIRAGESVTFTAPAAAQSLRITPTILYDTNRFSDVTSITVNPTLTFNLIKIKGGGRVAGHNLFSFNLNPFGTQTLDDTFPLKLFDQSFALPAPTGFTCSTFGIGATTLMAVKDFPSITRTLSDNNGFADISGSLPEAAGSTILLRVQGSQGSTVSSSDVNRDGSFQVTIRDVTQLGQYQPLTVSGEYLDLQTNQIVAINPVTIYWPRPALQAGQIGVITFDPNQVPNGNLVTYAGTGRFTLPLSSFNVEPDATLLYDDIPIPTSMTRKTRGYLVTGEIPGFLMDRGGVHTVSFLNSGLNQQPVVVQSVLVYNTVPTLTDVVKRKSEVDGSPLLLVRGTGFTLDTSVQIGGQSRPANLLSSAELRIPLLPADCIAGTHGVVVGNPAPGGGNVTGSYEIAPIVPDIPSLVAAHDLLRHQPAITNEPEGDTVADVITLTNAGKTDLSDVIITSVKLLVNGKSFVASGFPQTLPILRPGGYSSAQGILPPHSSVAGDVGILQVRGTAHGKAFVLSNRVKMPAFDQ